MAESGMEDASWCAGYRQLGGQKTDVITQFTIQLQKNLPWMIEAIQGKQDGWTFAIKFRKVDLLLVDDVHFLSRKRRSAGRIFPHLYAFIEKKKQIVWPLTVLPKIYLILENTLVTSIMKAALLV